MTFLETIVCSVVTGIAVWRFAAIRAQVRIDRVVAAMGSELEELTDEAQRWRTRAARLAQENDAWRAGHVQGRADVVAMLPLLVAAAQTHVTCTCDSADGTPVGSALSTLPPG